MKIGVTPSNHLGATSPGDAAAAARLDDEAHQHSVLNAAVARKKDGDRGRRVELGRGPAVAVAAVELAAV